MTEETRRAVAVTGASTGIGETITATTDVMAPPTGSRTLERYVKSGAPGSVG